MLRMCLGGRMSERKLSSIPSSHSFIHKGAQLTIWALTAQRCVLGVKILKGIQHVAILGVFTDTPPTDHCMHGLGYLTVKSASEFSFCKAEDYLRL